MINSKQLNYTLLINQILQSNPHIHTNTQTPPLTHFSHSNLPYLILSSLSNPNFFNLNHSRLILLITCGLDESKDTHNPILIYSTRHGLFLTPLLARSNSVINTLYLYKNKFTLDNLLKLSQLDKSILNEKSCLRVF